jgi:hypothetical protein
LECNAQASQWIKTKAPKTGEGTLREQLELQSPATNTPGFCGMHTTLEMHKGINPREVATGVHLPDSNEITGIYSAENAVGTEFSQAGLYQPRAVRNCTD